MRSTTIRPGDLVYDLAQGHEPMIVTSTDLPSVGDLDNPLREQVKQADGNVAFGYDDDTPCVEAVYPSVKNAPSNTYTFPTTRILRPRVEAADDVDGTAAELAQATFLREMVADANRTSRKETVDAIVRTAHQTSLPDELVRQARELGELDASGAI